MLAATWSRLGWPTGPHLNRKIAGTRIASAASAVSAHIYTLPLYTVLVWRSDKQVVSLSGFCSENTEGVPGGPLRINEHTSTHSTFRISLNS